MNEIETFLAAVAKSRDLPAEVKENISAVKTLKRFVFDQALMSLIDSQIQACSRGVDYANKLRDRRQALAAYRDKPLLKGRIELGLDAHWLYVDIESQTLIFSECYENWGADG